MQNLIFKSGRAALEYVEKYFGDPYYLFEKTEDMKPYFGVVTKIMTPEYKSSDHFPSSCIFRHQMRNFYIQES